MTTPQLKTREEIDAMTTEELTAYTEAALAAKGRRMPSAMETVEAFGKVLDASFGEAAAMLIMQLAACAASEIVKEADIEKDVKKMNAFFAEQDDTLSAGKTFG